MDKTEIFIEKAREIHGNKYNYSKVEYVNSKTKVCIICPEHGEFWQRPSHHLDGHGCTICAIKKTVLRCRSNTKDFIEKATKIHINKYDYSKVEYVNNHTKVCIICPEHGEFWQLPSNHLRGEGCIKCRTDKVVQKRRLTTDSFIKKANFIHKYKYDYSKVNYVNSDTMVCIICPEHGEFWQKPHNHLFGNGCIKCWQECISKSKTLTNEEFIKRANIVHKGKYIYKDYYHSAKDKIQIICPIHGEFVQETESHLQGHGCPKCANVSSQPEYDIMQIIKELNPQQRDREILNGKEIDIYIPNLKIGIEYNGLHWHSEALGKDNRYHLDKLNKCNEQGIRLIQIFEDEWINHREICESKLKQICGLNHNPKIFARKCEVREITNKKEVYIFLDKNHIQGRTGCTIALGAYYNDKLVGVMTFKKEKERYWDLNRFATDINYQCIGVGGKLFKYFIRNYDFKEIKSFADRRWTTDPTDNLYVKLGFEFDSFVEPTYWYYNPKVDPYRRFHKFGFRKQPLHKQYGLPLTMTEREMTTALGYTRIWDCGMIKYIYKMMYDRE